MPVKQSDATFINTRCHLSKAKPKVAKHLKYWEHNKWSMKNKCAAKINSPASYKIVYPSLELLVNAKAQLTSAVTYFHSWHKQSVQTTHNRTELQNELHLKPMKSQATSVHSDFFLEQNRYRLGMFRLVFSIIDQNRCSRTLSLIDV